MSIDWSRLRLFNVVADAGSLTEGARRLNMSQPALSRQIQHLEQEAGAALFHRHARGLALTHEGEQLLAASREMTDRVDRVERAIQASRGRPTGEIRLTTTVAFGTVWLMRVIAPFMERYPDIRLRVVLSDDDLDLSTRAADVALRFHAPHQADLIQRPLAMVTQQICASPDYIARHGAPATLDELDHHQIIAYGDQAPQPMRSVNWLLTVGKAGRERSPVITVNNQYGVLRAVEQGLGIAVLPTYLIRTSGKLSIVLPEIAGPPFQIYFVYASELRGSVRVAALRDFLAGVITTAALTA